MGERPVRNDRSPPSSSTLPTALRGLAEQLADPERRYVWTSIATVVVPVLLVLSVRHLDVLGVGLFWMILCAVGTYTFIGRPLYRWSQSEESFARSFTRHLSIGIPLTPLKGDESLERAPVVTAGLMLACAGVFALPVEPYDLALDSCESQGWWWSNWTSMFSHADRMHLLGNMIFLWAFGAALESRTSRIRYLAAYLFLGTLANGASILGNVATGECGQGVGASGAISGVMGLFLVRCQFNRVPMGIPILGPAGLGMGLPVVYKVQVPAFALLALFFSRDLVGARATLDRSPIEVDYWAHIGGYLAGVAVAYCVGLHRDGAREALSAHALDASERRGFGARRARETLLERDPDHADALLARAREKSLYSKTAEGEQDYRRLILLLLKRDRRRAAEIFEEYYEKYLRPLCLGDQIELSPALAAAGKFDLAARCLELASGEAGVDPRQRTRAKLLEAAFLTDLGLMDAARAVYRRILSQHPEGEQAGIARARLGALGKEAVE